MPYPCDYNLERIGEQVFTLPVGSGCSEVGAAAAALPVAVAGGLRPVRAADLARGLVYVQAAVILLLLPRLPRASISALRPARLLHGALGLALLGCSGPRRRQLIRGGGGAGERGAEERRSRGFGEAGESGGGRGGEAAEVVVGRHGLVSS
uniref:Uncharacterized protein n=1 Tax=Triticum urartu TaxID=4572 RepID=A0A8R7UY61_TRIUA